MNVVQRIPFHVKLYVGIFVLLLLSIGTIGVMNVRQATLDAYDMGKDALKSSADTLHASLLLQN